MNYKDRERLMDALARAVIAYQDLALTYRNLKWEDAANDAEKQAELFLLKLKLARKNL